MKFEGLPQLPPEETAVAEKQQKIEESADIPVESVHAEKEVKLQAIRQEVDSWGDRLGEGVDEGIKETVAVYNAMGLPTSASCEGHFGSESEHGFPVPWVEVENPNKPQWRFEHEGEIYEQVAKKYGVTVDEVLHADNDEAWKAAVRLSAGQEETAEYKAWEEENEKLFKKTESLLQDFYRERNVPDEVRIIADRSVGGFRVHNGGKFYVPNSAKERLAIELTEEERKRIPEILRASQKEMGLFTEFLKKKYLEANTVPIPQENVGVSEADIIARKEADAKKIAELREQLGLPPEITQVDQNPETPNAGVSQKEVAPEKEEILTPEIAVQKLFSEMDELEIKTALELEKSAFLEKMTNLLRIASKTEDPQAYKFFRNNRHFQKLKIGSKFLIQNSFDRDLHGKIFAYLDSIGIKTTDEEKQEIKNSFEMSDAEKRKETLGSYAQNGLLTLKSAIEKGVLKETSSTPGDFSSAENLAELSGEEFGNVRGYELTAQDISDTLFYGRNSFFGVVLERGGESIDRAGQLPKIEVENRLRNSMIFVVKTSKVEISRRTENANKEDIIGRDIKPEEIDYLIVDRANLALAQETYGHLPIKIVEADSVEASIEGLYDGPYTLPNYKDKIDQIAKAEGSIWCHVARLPVETYPKEVAAKEQNQ